MLQAAIFAAAAGFSYGKRAIVPAWTFGAYLGALSGIGLANAVDRAKADGAAGR
jgi:hypothetical protein